jgi:non-ribosomal peptide synthetase component F
LPELELQYADFAVWQREWLGATELQKQLSYWKEQLGGASRLELPHDRARPAAPSYRGEKQWLQLTAELSEQLQALARAEGVTLFMVLLAAFQVLLSRYSGQTDISVGTPIANRKRAQLEELRGFFVNTLVLRTELGGDPSFVELLGRVREVALAAYAHQDLPFEKLVEELQPERSLSRNPLFDVLFAVQNAPRSEGRLGELRLERWGEGSKTTRVDLEVHVWEGRQGLGCMFVYATELFGAETMQRLMAHYEQLLRAVVADAGQRLSELPLLTSAEAEQLRQWNETSSGYPEQCIQELFEAQAEQRGGAVAVRCGGAELSYGELNERANQLAHYLRGQGVGAETRVGLCVERSLELVVGLLGILKAGGAYVPLDPVYPEARLKYMVADAGVRLLLTQRGLVKNWQGSGLQIVALDGGQELAGQERSNPSLITKPDNLAYVIYTSGSTGKPKGVLVSHQSVVHLVSTLQSQINFTSRDVWTCAHS